MEQQTFTSLFKDLISRLYDRLPSKRIPWRFFPGSEAPSRAGRR